MTETARIVRTGSPPVLTPTLGDRAAALAALLDQSRLPTPPGLAMQIVQSTSRPDSTPADVVRLLAQDPALCANVLRVVNSCVYGLPQPVGSLDRAVVVLGFARLRSLVLGLSLPAMQLPGIPDPAVRDYWTGSVSGALIARELATASRHPAPEDELVAGLLRDIGLVVLQQAHPDEWPAVVARRAAGPFDERCAVEAAAFGVDHADAGAELLRRWGLPDELTEPIRAHHAPDRLTTDRRPARNRAELLFLADRLAHLDVVVQDRPALKRTLALAEERFGLDRAALTRLLQGVVPKVKAFTALLNIRVGQLPDFGRVLAEGCEQLARLAVQSGSNPAALATPAPAGRLTAPEVILPAMAELPAFEPGFALKLPAGGCRLDGYHLREIIGRGGMGVVFKAREISLDRDVAVKMLAPGTADAVALVRFLREARTAAAIRHENVVTIYAVRETPDGAYLAMEFVPGKSLQQLVDTDGPVPIPDLITLARQAAAGLAAAHEKGIVHRDVKPGNILLEDGTGKVKLTDFGLAQAATDVRLSQDGTVVGTPAYMAPEQISNRTAEPASDLFALGGVLYFLATGQLPFDGSSQMAIMNAVCKTDPVPPRGYRPDLPRAVEAVILRLLKKKPADRFRSAADLAAALADAAADGSKPKASSMFRRWWGKG